MTGVVAVAYARELHIYTPDDPNAVTALAAAEAHGIDAELRHLNATVWERAHFAPELRGVTITDHRTPARFG
ncbi:hypothetical protein AB0J80_35920 [Actinoplanes sp. NPDC049548]|uniref:hypothetical protein n=1 Tax=Actinoplanes sp. NPDC049548 TaxID=3155152 RepID=UPI00342AC89D